MKLISFLNSHSERSEESSAAGALTIKQCSNVAMNPKSGFTLLELLVVIAIIAILVALGTVSYSTAQKRGRDSRIRSDLKEIQNALETYYSVNSGYPATYPGDLESYFSSGSVPTNPKTGSDYTYTTDGEATHAVYCVCSALETADTGNADSLGGAGVCSYVSSGDDYCVSNLQ